MKGLEDEQALMRRLGWRLMPVLVLMFLVAFIDRQNIGFASCRCSQTCTFPRQCSDLGRRCSSSAMSSSNTQSLALERYGARRWLALPGLRLRPHHAGAGVHRLGEHARVLRLLLGTVEAGIYPGVVYYLITWFPDPYRIRMLGFFTLGSSLGNMVGGPINGTLLDLNGWLGLAGWQWVFIGGGLLALLLAVVVVALLPSSPLTARFLDEKDRQLLAAIHARASTPTTTHENPWSALWIR